jgi:hypothetical protein
VAGAPRLVLVAVALAVLTTGACGRGVPPLAHTFESPDALAGAVIQCLARGDRPGLEALAVSEQEFRDHVWPDLPASRPERNLPLAYVWTEQFRGQQLELVGVEFTGAVSTYRTCKVHRESAVRVRMPDKSERRLRVFGSMIEQGGRYKVFSYVVD